MADLTPPKLPRAVGGKVNQFSDAATAKIVQVDYTLAAANAFVSSLATQLPAGKKFRFVFCSGKYAEWNQNKSLAFMGDTRRFKVGQFQFLVYSYTPEN